jgi:hypothetical protein
MAISPTEQQEMEHLQMKLHNRIRQRMKLHNQIKQRMKLHNQIRQRMTLYNRTRQRMEHKTLQANQTLLKAQGLRKITVIPMLTTQLSLRLLREDAP